MVTRKHRILKSFSTRGARTTITSSELQFWSVCAVARGGGPAPDPAARAPRAATSIELVGMQATALRARTHFRLVVGRSVSDALVEAIETHFLLLPASASEAVHGAFAKGICAQALSRVLRSQAHVDGRIYRLGRGEQRLNTTLTIN